ncbi:hypothetical protein BZG78_05350 [Salinivibrio sp. MA351]|uniref:hypothetical protein n=1 Tax=Salinivibrio sp. MA351 TaxID=1909453 RepID=UPI000988E346|nr:hypothetical protein [Salinivibrio sp. MA351]OOF00220.1 hypothetical protein BZG78_05350 [Salinivibrio sp. MA351]
MTIPDYQSLLLPLLKVVADQQAYTLRFICKRLKALMIDFGVSTGQVFEVKQLNSDYFSE